MNTIVATTIARFGQLDVLDVAPLVTAPTLVLHSRGDMRVPFEEGRKLAALVPNAPQQ